MGSPQKYLCIGGGGGAEIKIFKANGGAMNKGCA